MLAIFESLPNLVDELPNEEARGAIVSAVWPTILGDQLRDRSVTQRFVNGTLSVAVCGADWKREFGEHAAAIVYKLNRTFGKKVVGRIEFTVDADAVERANSKRKTKSVGPEMRSPPPLELKKASALIADTELRLHFLEAAAACIKHRDAK